MMYRGTMLLVAGALLGPVLGGCRAVPRNFGHRDPISWVPSADVGQPATESETNGMASSTSDEDTEPSRPRLPLALEAEEGVRLISLTDVLRVVGDESLALGIARERAKMAQADEQFVLDSLIPSIGVDVRVIGADGFVQTTSGLILDVDRHNTFVGATSRVDIDPAGVYYRSEEAEALAEASVYAIHSTSNDALHEAANRYIDLVESYVQLGIAKGSTGHYRELVDFELARFEAGAISETQVLRAQARLTRASRDEVSARSGAEAASAALVAMLGFSPALSLYPAEEDLSLIRLVGLDDPQQLIELGLRRRPELAEATALIRSALGEHDYYQNSWMFPHLEGTASYGGLGENEEDLEQNFTYYFTLSWEALLSDRSGRQRARANHRRAMLEEERVRRDITQEVVSAHSKVRSALILIDSAIEEVRATQELFDSLKVRYESGDVEQIDVLWAELDLVSAQNSLANAVGGHNRAQYDLLRAIGGPLE